MYSGNLLNIYPCNNKRTHHRIHAPQVGGHSKLKYTFGIQKVDLIQKSH